MVKFKLVCVNARPMRSETKYTEQSDKLIKIAGELGGLHAIMLQETHMNGEIKFNGYDSYQAPTLNLMVKYPEKEVW